MNRGSGQHPVSDEISEQARTGVLWLGFVNVATKGSQVIVTLVLAVIFSEADFGIIALALALVTTAMVVQSMGVNSIISRTERNHHVMAGTVLTMSLLPSTVLTVVGVVGAPRIAEALGAPEAAPLIATVATGLPFMAVAWLQMALMNRALDFRLRMLPDVGSAVIGALVTIGLALRGTGPMSVAIGFVVSAVLQPIFGLLVGVRVRPRWDRGAAGEAVHWIANVGLGVVVYSVIVNVDYPIVSRILGSDSLGLYSLAFRIGWLPYLLLGVVVSSVAFPVYARLIRDGRQSELRAAVARFTHVLLLAVGGMYVVVLLLADRVEVFGDRWAPAAPALMVLCAYGLGLSLLRLWYQTVIVSARLRRYLCFEVGHLTLLIILLLIFTRYGITAAAFAQAASAWAMATVTLVTLFRENVAPPLADLARATLGFTLPAVACVGVVLLARWADIDPDPSSVVAAAVEFVALALLYAGVAALANRSLLTSLRKRGKASAK